MCCCGIQESVIERGYAVIIQNERYERKDIGSSISGTVMDMFFRDSGFTTVLHTNFTAEVVIYFVCFNRNTINYTMFKNIVMCIF